MIARLTDWWRRHTHQAARIAALQEELSTVVDELTLAAQWRQRTHHTPAGRTLHLLDQADALVGDGITLFDEPTDDALRDWMARARHLRAEVRRPLRPATDSDVVRRAYGPVPPQPPQEET